jgi:hypothetical protein
MSRPSVNARYMGQFMRSVARLPEATQVRTAIGHAALNEIVESKSFFAWLPVEHNLAATRAVATTLGPRRAHEFFVSLQVDALRMPIFSWVSRLVPTLLGNPGPALRWVAKGYEIMFRDAGTWEVVDEQRGSAFMHMVDVPEAMLQDTVWLASVASALHAIFVVAEVEGAVTLAAANPRQGSARFRFLWTER